MSNNSMSILLPEVLTEHVLERIAEGSFSDPSDYVRSLIRADMERLDEELEALLLEGIDSGPAEPMTEKDWEHIRSEARRLARSGATET
jgi:antitoxin ParD1/3/4